jgi:hypothetical protein
MKIRIIYLISVLIIFISIQNIVFASEKIGTGKTDNGKTVIMLSDGTWRYPMSDSNDKKLPAYNLVKKWIWQLCSEKSDKTKDPLTWSKEKILVSYNSFHGFAKMGGKSTKDFNDCVGQATGCDEFISLLQVCTKK